MALHVTHDSNIAFALDGAVVVLMECERLFGIRHFKFEEKVPDALTPTHCSVLPSTVPKCLC